MIISEAGKSGIKSHYLVKTKNVTSSCNLPGKRNTNRKSTEIPADWLKAFNMPAALPEPK
jgi:hypothetical protein